MTIYSNIRSLGFLYGLCYCGNEEINKEKKQNLNLCDDLLQTSGSQTLEVLVEVPDFPNTTS